MPRSRERIRLPGAKISFDAHIGNRIRERRIALGLASYQLAGVMGVSYQQARKYERGTHRITAGQLYFIASALDVPISYFFDGLDGLSGPDTAAQRRLLEFTHNLGEIRDERHKEVLLAIVRLLGHDKR